MGEAQLTAIELLRASSVLIFPINQPDTVWINPGYK